MNLNHIHIGTRDLKKSVEFYKSFFGFRKKFDHAPGVFLENDAGFLLAIDPVKDVPDLPDWFHFGFCLKTESEVHELYQKIIRGKIKIARDLLAEPGQFASFYILDPDGYRLEVSWHLD